MQSNYFLRFYANIRGKKCTFLHTLCLFCANKHVFPLVFLVFATFFFSLTPGYSLILNDSLAFSYSFTLSSYPKRFPPPQLLSASLLRG